MADKSVGELIAAQSVTPTDLFVLEQNGTAKKLTGQILENWLVSFADGHGGIQSIAKLSTSGLADTYRITMADTTSFDFVVTNGKGISSITKTATSDLVDTYTITYNDGTSGTFTVTNGAKGDKGDTMYLWIKYASQEPTAASHSFGDLPDNWIGVYSGASATAPTDWTQYQWFEIKGKTGSTGAPATLVSSTTEYLVSDSGTVIPSGAWSESIPVVAQGKYLWTRIVQTFNTGEPITAYTVSRMGLDGLGSVVSVCGVSPNSDGNVPLTAETIGARPNTWTPSASEVGALPKTGGDVSGWLNFTGTTQGIKWVTADGTEFQFRPYTKGNLLQIVRVDTDGNSHATMNVSNEGQISFGEHPLPISSGGTDAATAAEARTKLGITLPNIGALAAMETGTEYAIAVYYKGAQVYAKWVDFGALPNNTYKSLSIGVTPDKMVYISGFLFDTTNAAFVPFGGNDDVATCFVNSAGSLVIETTNDRTAWTGRFLLEYIK